MTIDDQQEPDDAELTAMRTVRRALDNLPDPAQARVLRWAADYYGVPR